MAISIIFIMLSEIVISLLEVLLKIKNLKIYFPNFISTITVSGASSKTITTFIISMIAILGANIYKTKYLKYMQQCSSTSLNIKQYIPENTAVFNKTGEVIEETSQLKKNQILIIRPNENIPCDGIVVEGYASVDESTLTGVQSNITKSEGSYVYAGTRCLQGSLQIRVEKIGERQHCYSLQN